MQIFKDQVDALIQDAKAKRNDRDRQFLMENIGKEIGQNLKPLMQTLADNSRLNKEDFKEMIGYMKDELRKIDIPVPEIIMPKIPEPKVTVNIPPIKIPKMEFPEGELTIKGGVSLMGVDMNHPLPVQLRDEKGNLVRLFENLTQVVGGGGGGFAKTINVGGINDSAWGSMLNADGRLRVETNDSGAAATEVRQVSGAVDSVVVNDVLVTVGVNQVSGANWSVSASDLDIRDLNISQDEILVHQVSGASWSVNAGTVTVTATDLDIRDLVNATDSIAAYQVSGATWSVSVNDAFRTTAASNLINSDDRLRVSVETGGSGLTDAELRASSIPVAQVSGAIWSTEVTNTVPVSATDLDIRNLVNATDSIAAYQVSGANWSVSVAESKAEDAAHASGDTGFMALSVRNSTNTTFAADGDYQPIATDGIGRLITRPVQVRGLLQTAYVSVTTGTEATLLAGAAGTFFDLIYVMGTNNSDAAVTVDLRAATGGGIQTSIRIPANAPAGFSLATPIPQDVAADTWTVDMPDITGTTVTVSALFSREV